MEGEDGEGRGREGREGHLSKLAASLEVKVHQVVHQSCHPW